MFYKMKIVYIQCTQLDGIYYSGCKTHCEILVCHLKLSNLYIYVNLIIKYVNLIMKYVNLIIK